MEKGQLRVFIRRFDFTLEMFFIIKNKETAFGIPIFHLLQAIVRVDVLQKT